MLSILAETIEKIRNIGKSKKNLMFVQQYLLHKGLKIYGENGRAAAQKEAQQLLDRVCFKPVKKEDLTSSELRKAQIALMYLTQKNNGVYKGQLVFNGKPTDKMTSDFMTKPLQGEKFDTHGKEILGEK